MIISMNFIKSLSITVLLIFIVNAGNISASEDEVAELVQKGDKYYAKFDNTDALTEYKQAYDQEPDDWEALMKLTRAYNDIGEEYKDKSSQKAVDYFEKGFELAELMKEKYPQSPESYFYMAVTRGNLAMFKGGKDKVKLGRDVEQYAKKAIELDPNYGPAYIALGVYYREVANLNWFLKKFARAFFGGLPEGTNEDSLKMLYNAKELLPNIVYVEYELGKTYRAMGEKEKMKEHFDKALKIPNTDHRDKVFKMRMRYMLAAESN